MPFHYNYMSKIQNEKDSSSPYRPQIKYYPNRFNQNLIRTFQQQQQQQQQQSAKNALSL